MAILSFLTAVYLVIHGQRGAVLFVGYSLILALGATAIPPGGSLAAKDVIAFVGALRMQMVP